MKYSIGTVPFANAAPLVHFLADRGDVELSAASPANLVGMLERGEITAGLLPVAAYLENEDFDIIPGMSIASHGEVASVLLFLHRAIDDVRTVGVDRGSRTSVNLVHVLFEKFLGTRPEYAPVDPADGVSRESDATLLIGDAALKCDTGGTDRVDMGAFWRDRTGLPFVYAAWTYKAGADLGALPEVLRKAKDAGLGAPAEVAARAAGRSGIGERRILEYLENNIRYGLGREEEAGIRLFQEYLFELGILEKKREINITRT